MNNIDVSIIIPVKDGERYLDSVLKGIYSQEIDAKFEVVIIDSGSEDETLDIIAQYPARLYQIKESDFNHGLTRNYAISKSQGKYIILMGADVIPYDNHWMKILVNNLERDKQAAGVYSRQVPHKDSHSLTQIRVNRAFTSSRIRRESVINNIEEYNRLPPGEKHRLCSFDNVSSCIKKAMWEKMPFPKTDFGEDIEWARDVLLAGYKIIYEPDSIVYHSHDFSIYEWYSKNEVNYKKLSILFELNGIDNFYKLFINFFAYTLRDIYLLCKDKKQHGAVLSNIFFVPIYSFFGVLGQYRGIHQR